MNSIDYTTRSIPTHTSSNGQPIRIVQVITCTDCTQYHVFIPHYQVTYMYLNTVTHTCAHVQGLERVCVQLWIRRISPSLSKLKFKSTVIVQHRRTNNSGNPIQTVSRIHLNDSLIYYAQYIHLCVQQYMQDHLTMYSYHLEFKLSILLYAVNGWPMHTHLQAWYTITQSCKHHKFWNSNVWLL